MDAVHGRRKLGWLLRLRILTLRRSKSLTGCVAIIGTGLSCGVFCDGFRVRVIAFAYCSCTFLRRWCYGLTRLVWVYSFRGSWVGSLEGRS